MTEKSFFEKPIPLSRGHEVRKQKALEEGDWYQADKEEVLQLLLEMKMSVGFDTELEARVVKFISDLSEAKAVYQGWGHEREVKECGDFIQQLQEALEIFSQKK
ncbi:MAG: hypothetical protein KIH67_001010 [Candidatus Moranbacteria bacterium]|nr:hypothetical protein [Candidatus Moranbacteria bacterium]